MVPGASPLFTLNWIYADPKEKPGKLESNRDFLAALQNAAVDRGDRSFHYPTGILTWQGSGWRMRDMLAFVVDIDADQDVDRAVEWLQKRGYPDSEQQKGFAYEFILERQMVLTLGSTKPVGGLIHIDFGECHWMIAEKWAVNLSRVVSYQTIYGDLDVIAQNWT
jgi:hypothetical protein